MICILRVIHYFWLMFSKNVRKMCLKIKELDLVNFFSAPGLAWQVKLELLTDIDMLLMSEKGIRGGICHAIHQYAKANKIYIKDCDKESLYIKYLDLNDLYGWQCRKGFQ